jgi:hypothetical protein
VKSRASGGALGAALLAGFLALQSCTDEVPTSTDPALIPVEVETFEVLLPFGDFADGFRIDGGYGTPSSLSTNRIILSEDETFEVRPVLRYPSGPAVVQVFPPGETQTVPDSNYVTTGGRVTITFDTASHRLEGLPPYEIEAASVLEGWHTITASWTHAVDSIGGVVPWSEPGGGAVRHLETFLFDPSDSTSVTFELDSLTASEWIVTENLARGLRLRMTEPGKAIRISSTSVEYDLVSEVDPDTALTFSGSPVTSASTMLLSRPADGGEGRMLVGGAPSHRSTFRFQLPDSVDAPSALCPGDGPCRVEVTAERVLFAGVNFTTMPTSPAALVPRDSLILDMRPVLAPDRLPRSPLGTPVLPEGRIVGGEQFDEDGEAIIEIPATRLVRDLVRHARQGGDDDPPPSTVSLISAAEPSGIGVATFRGPGTQGAPFLRIIMTTSDGVTLP